MRNGSAAASVLAALLALGALALGAYVAWTNRLTWLEAAAAVPVSGFFAVLSLALAGRARTVHQRTLGRAGGSALAGLGRGLGLLALVVTLTAALALGVFAVLVLTEGLTRAPW